VLTDQHRNGSHLGQVQDAGRTVGVIALEDVVEAFVGEVEDASHLDAEHDPQPGPATAQEADRQAAPAVTPSGLPPEPPAGADQR
jgi:CBS domain containing-hemolysin-like protein